MTCGGKSDQQQLQNKELTRQTDMVLWCSVKEEVSSASKEDVGRKEEAAEKSPVISVRAGMKVVASTCYMDALHRCSLRR